MLPELNIEEGFVDYAILSGRSRMDITLIEIKGANFDLMSSTGYRNFSYKTNEALQQVRGREGSIIRDYPKFQDQRGIERKCIRRNFRRRTKP